MPRGASATLIARCLEKFIHPRMLLQIGSSRFADGTDANDNPISWNGNTWVERHMELLGGLQIQMGFMRGFTMDFPIERDEIALFRSYRADTDIRLYLTDTFTSYAADDVVEIFDGEMTGGLDIDDLVATINSRGGAAIYPRARANARTGFTAALEPGHYSYLGGQYVITMRRA